MAAYDEKDYDMNIKKIVVATAMVAFVGYGMVAPAHAEILGMGELKTAQVQKAKITIIEAIALAEKDQKGTVVKAELEEDDDKLMYEIELLDNDKETEVYVDAMTGVVSMDDD